MVAAKKKTVPVVEAKVDDGPPRLALRLSKSLKGRVVEAAEAHAGIALVPITQTQLARLALQRGVQVVKGKATLRPEDPSMKAESIARIVSTSHSFSRTRFRLAQAAISTDGKGR